MNEDAGGFRYEDESHTYWQGKTRLLGVSEIIKAAGLKSFDGIPEETLERARQRGKAVHDAIRYLIEGDLEWASVSPEIEPYVRAWECFQNDMGSSFAIVEHETPVYRSDIGAAVTPDLIFRINGDEGILDFKTYKPDAVTGVQTAGYKEIKYGGALGQCTRRWGLWLKNTGKYSLTEFKAGTDAVIFHSALAIANFKRRHSDERS